MPEANSMILSIIFIFATKKFIKDALMATIPKIAVINTGNKLPHVQSPCNNNTGLDTKTYGIMNAAIDSLKATTPAFIGLAFAIPAPAYAAKHTGGVISATIPK